MFLSALKLPPGSFTECPLVLASREALAAEETNRSSAESAAARGAELSFPHHTLVLLGAQSLAPPRLLGVKVWALSLPWVGAAGPWGGGMGTSKQSLLSSSHLHPSGGVAR